MADIQRWKAFVRELRGRQDALREEAQPYEAGIMRICRGMAGGPLRDITGERIATIKDEIASLERAIRFVIAEQALDDA